MHKTTTETASTCRRYCRVPDHAQKVEIDFDTGGFEYDEVVDSDGLEPGAIWHLNNNDPIEIPQLILFCSFQFRKNIDSEYKMEIFTIHLSVLETHKSFLGKDVYKFVDSFRYADDINAGNI